MKKTDISEELIGYGGKDPGVLKRFMKEFFPFGALKKEGFFKPEMKDDYYAQAKRVCVWFGYETVFEYGAKEIECHITYAKGHRPEGEPFVTVIPSIYD
jgi:hypothetical protein